MPSLSMYATELRKRAGCCGFVRAAPIFVRNREKSRESHSVSSAAWCVVHVGTMLAQGAALGAWEMCFYAIQKIILLRGGFGNFSDARKIEVNKEFFRGP